MPYRDIGFWNEMIAVAKDYYASFLYFASILIGRFVYWSHIKRRFPTFREFLLEPFLVFFCGVFWGGIIEWMEIPDGPITYGILAVGGLYGAKGVVVMFSAACKKFGFSKKDICSVDDIIKPD
ncbi:MAG: hypothetical protein GOVbin631_88 [Prokaryotic dsDNA virus sp.]|nr:MAG: hypothetical protein GOVbin631_88 [Prokaryotic dsDNA virus sp.]|tara:strand:- start:38004 stop:38372 length:369 start_codon:yes stop_codon:yes gene_type:complete